MTTHTDKFLRKRKFLLVLPALIVPFLVLIFWSLGGGKPAAAASQPSQGLNTALPDAKLPSGELDKMSLYNQAAADSLDRRRQDAGSLFSFQDSLQQPTADSLPQYTANNTASSYGSYQLNVDPNEARVRDRLDRLERALNQPAEGPAYTREPSNPYQPTGSNGQDLDRLEQMMQTVTSGGSGADAELQQLNGMLEKVLDIQNPERMQQKIKEQSQRNKGRVFLLNKPQEMKQASLIARNSSVPGARLIADTPVPTYEPMARNTFYGLAANTDADSGQTAVPAVIHETQTLVSGATVKLRLLEDVMINGTLIAKGSFVFGNCSIAGERLKIDIPGIRSGKRLFPVSLSAYDMDGLEGIRIPGAITRDAAKEGADQMVQSLQFMNMDPSLVSQAASTGVEVAKGLFGKKTRLVRVTVKAGYAVLLLDDKAKQDAN